MGTVAVMQSSVGLEMTTYHCHDEDCHYVWTDEAEVHFCPRCGSTSISEVEKIRVA